MDFISYETDIGWDSPEGIRRLIKERLLVRRHKGVFHRGKDTDLVQGVFFFSVRQVLNLDLLERIDLAVFEALDFVDT